MRWGEAPLQPLLVALLQPRASLRDGPRLLGPRLVPSPTHDQVRGLSSLSLPTPPKWQPGRGGGGVPYS